MKTDRMNRNRKMSLLNFSDLIFNTHSPSILDKLTMITLLPVLFSCVKTDDIGSWNVSPKSREYETDVCFTKGETGLKTLDLFTFEAGPLAHLDAYMRTDRWDGDAVTMMSGQGEKILFACANGQCDRYDWAAISSVSSLDGIHADLEKERRHELLMTATGRTMAGSGKPCCLELRPLTCEVRLRSIRCDFTGRPYQGERLKDVSVYLTNVNAQCSITADGMTMPTRIVNHGGLSEEDMDAFREPGLLYRKIDEDIGDIAARPDISLLCYPNASEEESPGSPFTRLVIEGTVEGETYWWPVDINRSRDGSGTEEGLYRNCSYVYDIVIRRKGSDDPDTALKIEDIEIEMKVLPWKEKDGYSVGF